MKCYWNTDACIKQHIIVGKVVNHTMIVLRFHSQPAQEILRQSGSIEIPSSRSQGYTQHLRVYSNDCGRTGKKKILECRSLKGPVIGHMKNGPSARPIPRNAQARTNPAIFHQELIMVPTHAQAQGPMSHIYEILCIQRLFPVNSFSDKAE